MFTKNLIASKLHAQVFDSLYQKDACLRCILRIFKVDNMLQYRERGMYYDILKSVDELQESPNTAPNYDFLNLKKQCTTMDHNHCSICMGILQTIDNRETVNLIIKQIKDQDFEFSSFKFCIKTPLTVAIRQFHIMSIVEEELKNKGIDVTVLGKNFFNLAEVLFTINVILHDSIDVKLILKWILAPIIAEELKVKSNQDDKFSVNLELFQKADETAIFKNFEHLVFTSFQEKKNKKIKNNSPPMIEITSTALSRILHLDKSVIIGILGSKPIPTELPPELKVICQHENIFIMGHYNKYSRQMSQTPWEVDGKAMFNTSLQEEIAKHIMPYFKATQNSFHSGGREDIDVRMLGKGRPFVIEVINPRRSQSVTKDFLEEMEKAINQSPDVHVNSLSFSDEKTSMDYLKKSENQKIKAYMCVCSSSRPLSQADMDYLENLKGFQVAQKTPLRVLHRRTLMLRDKLIHKLQAKLINDHYFVLIVLSSAGTYIKEFVHGDLERTKPNVGTLLKTDADIYQLDVLELYEDLTPEALADFATLKNKYCNSLQKSYHLQIKAKQKKNTADSKNNKQKKIQKMNFKIMYDQLTIQQKKNILYFVDVNIWQIQANRNSIS